MLAKTKIASLMLVAAVALASPMIVYADSSAPADASYHDGDWYHGQHEHMIAKVLNLSADQVKQLKDIHEKKEQAMKSTFEQMKTQKQAFDAEIVKATPDMNKINDIQTQLKTIQTQMVDNHLSSLLEIKKILTPEQFAGYMALEGAKKMMMHHHGHHPFGQKNGMGKDGGHWGDKDGIDHDGGPQD